MSVKSSYFETLLRNHGLQTPDEGFLNETNLNMADKYSLTITKNYCAYGNLKTISLLLFDLLGLNNTSKSIFHVKV